MRSVPVRLVLVGLLVVACSELPGPEEIRDSRLGMGTLIEVVVRHPDRARAQGAIDAAFDEMIRLEALLSEWLETSEVSRLNRSAGSDPVPMYYFPKAL